MGVKQRILVFTKLAKTNISLQTRSCSDSLLPTPSNVNGGISSWWCARTKICLMMLGRVWCLSWASVNSTSTSVCDKGGALILLGWTQTARQAHLQRAGEQAARCLPCCRLNHFFSCCGYPTKWHFWGRFFKRHSYSYTGSRCACIVSLLRLQYIYIHLMRALCAVPCLCL